MLLVLFDMDGTLIDSQGHIVGSMNLAFEREGAPVPTRDAVLSLPQAIFKLYPEADLDLRNRLVEGYKNAFVELRSAGVEAPMYPGAKDCLEGLNTYDHVVMGVATGKTRRGVEAAFDQHDLRPFFVTSQVADDHPSKPHPSMGMTALMESGGDGGVMIGDTTYDMEMGKAAGMKTIGVTWGYHPVDHLSKHADAICESYDQIIPTLNDMGLL
ncbi:MAG: HAD-IA family hydrolase [Planktomarina sp.]